MERRDQEAYRQVVRGANYSHDVIETVDESTVQLFGSRAEADIIVAGIQALRGKLILDQASTMISLVDTHSLAVVEKLLSEIEKPNYAANSLPNGIWPE